MPVVEEEVGTELGRLIERNVSGLKTRLGWQDLTSSQGNWLLKTVFWLISGKILRDKQVATFEELNLLDVNDVFERVATHYGTDPFVAGSKAKQEALEESARDIERFSSLALATTESLAYVYENTLISKATRSALGTHSTPPFLVDYVVGNLAEWIQEIPENNRSVFEPACGHAAFLVSAMRLLAELLPPEKAKPSRRGPYLRSRLHGTDIDSFALELARLSLSLTDVPNPDGWDLSLQDMFVGNLLEEQAETNTILLANPPFGNFKRIDRKEYSKKDVELHFVNRATEVLWRTIPQLSPGSVFGVVLPQTFLHSQKAVEVRRFLAQNCELKEICLFPDKVFSFSDAESAVLLGRRFPSPSPKDFKTRYRHVREPQMPQFRESFEVSRTEMISQSQFCQSADCDFRVPDLAGVWEALSGMTTLGEIADVGQGLVYLGRDLPEGATTYSDQQFSGAVQGFVRFGSQLNLHQLPSLWWMNLNPDVIRRPGSGTTTGVPQVLLNYAPVSRGPWRLKALIDPVGRPVTSRFTVVRPHDHNCSLELIWALLNSPVANAYAFTHSSKRDNLTGAMRQIPVPSINAAAGIAKAAHSYFNAATSGDEPQVLKHLLSRLDVEILKLYDLPIGLEWELLNLFRGSNRAGVPFEQSRYFPEGLDGPMRFADFLEFAEDWSTTNRERGQFIDKDIAGNLTPDKKARLDALQRYADYYLDLVAPRSTDGLDELENQLSASSQKGRKEN